jgi:hypothetical protein
MSLLLASGGGAVTHDASGALVGPGAIVSGAANRVRAFATSGALVGPGASVSGAAGRFRAFATSGVLTGPGAIIVGQAELTKQPQVGGGGGGPGNAVSIRRRNQRGWANERAALEYSLQEFDRQRRADLERIAQTLVDSGQAQAQRIARKLADYTGELAQVESLQRELAKLEASQRSRELWAERNQDVQAAAAELSDILRDDEDVAGALVALHENEARLMLGVLGIAID